MHSLRASRNIEREFSGGLSAGRVHSFAFGSGNSEDSHGDLRATARLLNSNDDHNGHNTTGMVVGKSIDMTGGDSGALSRMG